MESLLELLDELAGFISTWVDSSLARRIHLGGNGEVRDKDCNRAIQIEMMTGSRKRYAQ